jgi:hypothetical protein
VTFRVRWKNVGEPPVLQQIGQPRRSTRADEKPTRDDAETADAQDDTEAHGRSHIEPAEDVDAHGMHHGPGDDPGFRAKNADRSDDPEQPPA